jgi:hypothetical protein
VLDEHVVVPYCSLTSQHEAAVLFSSMVMPAIGSSEQQRDGSAASARASSTLLQAVQASDRRLADVLDLEEVDDRLDPLAMLHFSAGAQVIACSRNVACTSACARS